MPDRQILACDLGGTRMRIALVSLQGHVHDKQVVLSLDNNPNTLIDALRTALEQAPGKIEGAVIGVPGMVDYHNQEVVKLPNLAAWEGTISGQRLSDALGLETLLANDADLGALGEYRYGAGRGSQDIVYVAAGTGVGSGVVLNGRLLKGRFSLGEIGHTIIDRTTGGTVEELASGIALRRSLGLDVSELAERAAKGDPEATRVFDELCRDLSIGIYNLVHCFSPELVVVGGGMTTAGEPLLEPMRAMLARAGPYRLASSVRVVRAETGDDVGLLGAAAFWSESHLS
jgi:glucokinase